MARKKTPPLRASVKAQLSRRLRAVREELFGEHGGPELARRLGLPARTWYNYESGVTVPAEVLLTFIDQTGANPIWLLSGEGPTYRRSLEADLLDDLTPEQLIRRGLEKLEQEPGEGCGRPAPEPPRAPPLGEFIAVDLVPLDRLDPTPSPAPAAIGQVLAYRQWIPHTRDTVAVRLEDEAMHPILPAGSVVAIDRAVRTPQRLQGRMVAARVGSRTFVRWLEVAGRHLILRPSTASREFPSLPVELTDEGQNPIVGQVVWSWSRFND